MSNSPQVDRNESSGSLTGPAVAPAPYHKPHFDHGHSPARWTGVVISAVGATVGGVAFPFHQWAVVYAGGALQVVALIVVVAMNAAGYGVADVWGELKAEARANEAGIGAVPAAAPAAVVSPRKAEAQVKELSAH
jgi:NADH:ubiquinone oxidoreductase subunit 2 (subunit N)